MGMTAILVMWPEPFEQTFVPPSHEGYKWNLASIGLAVSKDKNNKMLNLSDLGPRPMNDLDLLYLYRFINHLVNCIYQLRHHRLQKILKNPLFYLFPIHLHKGPNIWSCHKIGQGQHSVIIWTNLVALEHPMMQIKFQCYRPFGAREEDFF